MAPPPPVDGRGGRAADEAHNGGVVRWRLLGSRDNEKSHRGGFVDPKRYRLGGRGVTKQLSPVQLTSARRIRCGATMRPLTNPARCCIKRPAGGGADQDAAARDWGEAWLIANAPAEPRGMSGILRIQLERHHGFLASLQVF